MALSQVQCLDDNHVNWRLNESKPEFFYSEDQRLALEALATKGRDAFDAYVKEHELRPFLSEPELELLRRNIEDYKPGSEHHKSDGTTEGDDSAVSLQYWPDRSDISIPNLDLGWPESSSYRGVTRVNVYTQPPLDGQTHIKEVVRKAIAQAQKVGRNLKSTIVWSVLQSRPLKRKALNRFLCLLCFRGLILKRNFCQQFLLHNCPR